jgi:hypothetical protein
MIKGFVYGAKLWRQIMGFRIPLIGLVLLSVVVAGSASASVVTYTGSLTNTGGGISVNPGSHWASDPVTIAWTVTNDPATTGYVSHLGMPWEYTYEFTANRNLSHIIIETSLNATSTDFYFPSATPTPVFDTFSPDDPGKSNPALPSSIHGMKFTPATGTKDFKFTFYSDRAPVWGDFYAKDGNDTPANAAWDSGLATLGTPYPNCDSDPTAAPANGSVDNNILRPDGTATNGGVPEPATIIVWSLLGSLAIAAGWRQRRRTA